ncbi:cytochrome P450 [Kitasatospora sp. MAA4]|uniref:cytochrome P450 n=1 Tax=Kitasatospora sp. MAA4 TaxID=3035093 RepID=UPI00247302DA|nr:cytochrome P450 [Kitasatospora sp. MAA4]
MVGTSFLTRFADCQAVLASSDFLVPDLEWCERELPEWREHPAADFFYTSMLGSNGARHERLRRLVAAAFTPRRVAGLRATVEKISAELLDGFADALAGGGTADFQDLVGYPLPVAVVGELIGVPRGDQAQFRALGQGASRLLEPVRTVEDWARADRAVAALREYFAGLLRERRVSPADDLASALLLMRDTDQGRLSERELVDTLILVFVAGFETATGMLGLTVFALLTHPDQAALVREDPGLAPAAVEESLRWDAPVLMTERIAARPVEVGGVAIPAGGSVTTVLGAANRDPARHPEPDAFTVRRPDVRVLSFSAGAHYCLGAALARVEGAVLIGQLLSRFPGLGQAGQPVRRASIGLRSFDVLPLARAG